MADTRSLRLDGRALVRALLEADPGAGIGMFDHPRTSAHLPVLGGAGYSAGTPHVERFDVAAETEAVDALAAEREQLGLVKTLPVGIAKFDRAGRVEHVNQRMAHLLAPALVSDVFRDAVEGTLEPAALSAAFSALVRNGEATKLDVELTLGHQTRQLEWRLRPVRDRYGDVAGGVACVADVSESVELRAALEHRARTDLLTGCLNRSGTVQAIERLLEPSAEGEVGLLSIDLDDFKSINDTYGHRTGDLVLKVVALRLRAAARNGDVVGRLGRDEFAVAMPSVPTAQAALALGHRVADVVRGSARIGEHTLDISASVGVAWVTATDAGDLLRAAHGAMKAAKQEQRLSPVLAA